MERLRFCPTNPDLLRLLLFRFLFCPLFLLRCGENDLSSEVTESRRLGRRGGVTAGVVTAVTATAAVVTAFAANANKDGERRSNRRRLLYQTRRFVNVIVIVVSVVNFVVTIVTLQFLDKDGADDGDDDDDDDDDDNDDDDETILSSPWFRNVPFANSTFFPLRGSSTFFASLVK